MHFISENIHTANMNLNIFLLLIHIPIVHTQAKVSDKQIYTLSVGLQKSKQTDSTRKYNYFANIGYFIDTCSC